MPVALAESGCPEQFAVCLDVVAAIALEKNLRHSKSWQTEAWIRCGPPPDAGTRDGG